MIPLFAFASPFFLVSPTFPADATPAKAFDVEAVENLAYYDGPGADPVRHKLDVFYPKGGRDCPVVLLVHGGAWVGGDKSHYGQYSAVGRFLAANGVVAVLPNYRLSPRVKHPEHIKDVARAFAWAVRNCPQYGGRPDQVFAAGHSAGGHLVALLATDATYLQAEGLKPSAVKGVIGISGVYRIPEIHLLLGGDGMAMADLGGGAPAMPKPGAWGFDITIDPFRLVFGPDLKVRQQASPLSHVREGLPPFLLYYAERELPQLGPMAEEFVAAINEKRGEAEVHKVAGRTHRSIMFGATTADDPVAAGMLAFIRKYAR